MSEMLKFSAIDLPEYFLWQMRDFIRMQWYQEIKELDNIVDDTTDSLHPDKWHPTYIILAKNRVLISAVSVLWKNFYFQGEHYKVYGLGAMMTYPAYRRQGYGRLIVESATQYMRQDKDADFALLQTAPSLEKLYQEHGWEFSPKMTLLSGLPEAPIDEDGWIMSLFLSERAKAIREALNTNPFYFDEHIW